VPLRKLLDVDRSRKTFRERAISSTVLVWVSAFIIGGSSGTLLTVGSIISWDFCKRFESFESLFKDILEYLVRGERLV
jgi:hypothetical protein